jgi:predicted TPR repeat methyltransferase
MNRKERRRQEKAAQKQAKTAKLAHGAPTQSAQTPGAAAGGGGVSSLLFNHAMNNAAAQQENELDWELQQISDKLNSGFTGEALQACQNLNLKHPNHPEIHQLSGIAHFMNQDWDQAIQCFEAVLTQDPKNVAALNYLGDLAIEKNDLTSAESYFQSAVKNSPDDLGSLQRLAYIYHRLENATEAAEIYPKIISIDPNSAENYLNYGYALFKNEHLQEAVEEYRRAIKLNPELGLAYINLGTALSGLDEDEEAISSFRRGLKISPDHAEGTIGLARCLRAQDDYEEAAMYFKQGLKLAPDRTAIFWELGYSLELSGDKAGGQAAYEKCLEHNPDHSVARHLLDSLMGNTTEAAPPDYIEELFDDYASSFDDSLVKELNYVVPKLIRAQLDKIERDQPIQSVLDLGGGTGLVAAEIKELVEPDSGIIHGVDLSSGMLEIADQNHRYDQTFVADISAFLDDKKIGLAHYELIIAGDVFVYIGNLDQVFSGAYARLEKSGCFIFTVEQSPDDDFGLQPTGRYAHSKNYVQELAGKHNFNISEIQEIIPRQDGDQAINGYLVSLQKN